METGPNMTDDGDVFADKADDSKSTLLRENSNQPQEKRIESLASENDSSVDVDHSTMSSPQNNKFVVLPVSDFPSNTDDGNSRTASTVHPPLDYFHYVPGAHSPRKLSSVSHPALSQPGSRRSSFEFFLHNPHRNRHSVFSLLSHPESAADTYGDTLEALPHVDNYRDLHQMLSTFSIHQRPTLLELREPKVMFLSYHYF